MAIYTFEYFRTDKVRCTCKSWHFVVKLLSLLSQPKINKLNLAVISVHNVLRLYIPMSDLEIVAMVDCFQQIFHDVGSFLLSERWILADSVDELTSCAILHDQIKVLAIFICLIVLSDVWMVKWTKNMHLLSNEIKLIGKFLFRNYFYCNAMVWVLFVTTKEDFSECSRTKNFGIYFVYEFELRDQTVLLQVGDGLLCLTAAHGFSINNYYT